MFLLDYQQPKKEHSIIGPDGEKRKTKSYSLSNCLFGVANIPLKSRAAEGKSAKLRKP